MQSSTFISLTLGFAFFSTLSIASTQATTASPSNVGIARGEALAISAPPPEYPLEARLRHATGSGILLLRVDIKTGRTKQVIIARTTGDKALDAAAVRAFVQWRFKPGVLPHPHVTSIHLNPPLTIEECLIKVPISFTLQR